MSELSKKIDAAVAAIRKRSDIVPEVGIILGTGLGGVAENIEKAVEIPYAEIPNFARSTAAGHAGILILGSLNGKPVVAMEGRLHRYEGYSLQDVTFPVRVMRALGARTLIVSNACGCLNPQWKKGDLILIEDHINLFGDNPLIGPNDDALGPRFPDMVEPYTHSLIDLAEAISCEEGIRAHRGVYVGLTGPCLETRAEYRFLRVIGADAVGMSTVPEVIVAVHAGLKVFGVGILTDVCLPDALQPVDIAEIISVANEAAPNLAKLILKLVQKM